MAKGNLFLGTAGNSVGDVVMYRREGSQVSRVRVRKVKNPKTDAQSLQRAAFSPVAKFYSPLAVVLERSFEGLSKAKSYAKFLKTNVDLARANGWLLPKGTGFFPLPYKLSQGTIKTLGAGYNAGDDGGFYIGGLSYETAPGNIEEFCELFVNAGYQYGDVVTLIAVGHSDTEQSGEYDKYAYFPISIQFELKADDSRNIGDVFGPNVTISFSQGSVWVNGAEGFELMGFSVIISRFENEKWRRSTQSLVVLPAIMTYIGTADFHAAAVASYGPNAGDPNPLVYLDGDTLEG